MGIIVLRARPGAGIARRLAVGLLLCAAAAQAADDASRPRVGLVLGGGGARGAAHIGVLEVLERLRVPVDCVAGTSMGALVAGAFAAGLSPAEMRTELTGADWGDMFQDNPAFYDMSYRNKRFSQAYLPGSELGVTENGLQYAPGVVSGQKIKAFFNHLVRSDRGERLIEDLPLPLSMIATDIATGERVVMRDGSLTQAMRASMSVPGLMAPAERDGRKLVDGGLVDNVPIREARERCRADVVIAVNVGSPLLKAEDIGSLLSVSAQMINLLTEQNVTQSLATLKTTDIYIKPDLEGITAGDFARSGETADRGRVAAEAVAGQLRRLAVGEAEYAAWLRRVDLAERPPPVVGQIEITGLQRVNPADLQSNISQKVGQPLDTAALDADLLRIYGEGYYERVDYMLLRERDRDILRVTPVEKSWGPDYIRFGLGVATDAKAASTYSLRAAYQSTWMNPLGGELLVFGQIGSELKAGLDFYQPVEPTQTFFVEPIVQFRGERVSVFQDDRRLADLDVSESTAQLAVGMRIGTVGQARLGLRQRHVRSKTDVGSADIPSYDVNYGAAFVGIDLDQMDRIYEPRNGWALAARYSLVDGGDYSSLQTALRGARGFDGWVVQGRVAYHGSPTGRLPVYDPAQLGGFLNLSSFAKDQLVGDDATYAGLRLERILTQLPLGLRGDMRLGFAAEAGRMGTLYTETNRTGWQDSYVLYIGGETPIGPVFVGVSRSRTSGYSNAYLVFGIP